MEVRYHVPGNVCWRLPQYGRAVSLVTRAWLGSLASWSSAPRAPGRSIDQKKKKKKKDAFCAVGTPPPRMVAPTKV